MSVDREEWKRFLEALFAIDYRDFSDESNHYADDVVDSSDAPVDAGGRKAEVAIAFEAGRRWERRCGESVS